MSGWGDFKAKPDIEYKSKVEKQVTDIFLDIVTQDNDEPYTPQIRSSSLPICILRHSIDLLKPHVRTNEANLEQYSAIGTALHELYQDQYLRSEKWGRYVYGNFRCRNKKCEAMLAEGCTRPKDWKTRKCPECGSTGMKYSEVEARYKGVLGIHVDMLLKFKGGRFWLKDFKTSGTYKIEDPSFKPKNKHMHQISSYPLILKRELGLDVERFFLGYVNRERPQHSKTSKRQSRWFPFKVDTAIMRERKKQLDALVKAEKLRKQYFDDPTEKNLDLLDAARPCKSLDDYTRPLLGMQDAFENSTKCSYARAKGGCFCSGRSKPAKVIHEMMKEK